VLNVRTLIIRLINTEVRFLETTWGRRGKHNKSFQICMSSCQDLKVKALILKLPLKTASSLRITGPLFSYFQGKLLHVEKLPLNSYRFKHSHITKIRAFHKRAHVNKYSRLFKAIEKG